MNRALVIGLALSVLLACRAPAAQPALEGFTSGANGWAGSFKLFTGTWTYTAGVARAVFGAGGIIGDIGTLSNTPSASSGSFTGNYDTAGIEVLGFSFRAPNALPASSAVELEWAGGTSVYRRGFSVTQTGVRYHFTASLKDEDQGQWEVIAGSSNNFAASAAYDHVVWDGLLAGVGYQVQSSTNLISGAWALRESLTAIGSLHATVVTNTLLDHEAMRMQFR